MKLTESDKMVNILIINPNSSKTMTEGIERMMMDLGYSKSTRITTYTAPSGPPSIDNEEDALGSAKIVLSDLGYRLPTMNYGGYLVACYSIHPLMSMLKAALPDYAPPIIGIFEASVSTALSLLPQPIANQYRKFGIVTTGKYWEKILTDGVMDYLGCDASTGSKKFKGVETTGLTAAELHTSPPQDVKKRIMDATKRLVQDGDVDVICLGCAGMAGMDDTVRAACVEKLGRERGDRIHIIDGVKGGIAVLDGLARGKAV